MTILNTDIKIFMSQDNTDNPDGGGFRTPVVLPDGGLNNGLPDISRIDTVGGTVNLRKFHPVVDTDSTEIYYGAHAILTKTPADPKVSALLFSTNSPSDVRVDAQKAIESYVVSSYKDSFYLFGNHVKGAQAVTWLQRLGESPPDIGEVYMLQSADGIITEYIRIADIEVNEITLSKNSSEYQRRRIIAEIEQPLEFAHIGSIFDPDGQTSGTSTTFATQVANAAKFYGLKDLSANAAIGDFTVQVDSITEQIVPASKAQTPIINRDALLQGAVLIQNPVGQVVSVGGIIKNGDTLPTSVVPNSFNWSNQVVDDGNGGLLESGVSVGTIDYITGYYNYKGLGLGGTVQYIVAISRNIISSFTAAILITQENQGTVFVQNISPMPSLANFYINYISNGKWYQLNSNLDGTIGGSDLGAGSINDNGDGTATISLTLGAIPDIDSSIIYTWGSDFNYDDAVADINANFNIVTKIQLPNTDIKAASLLLAIYRYDSTLNITFDNNGTGSNTDFTLDKNTGVIRITGVNALKLNSTHINNKVSYDYASNPASNTSVFNTVNAPLTPSDTFQLPTVVYRPTMRLVFSFISIGKPMYIDCIVINTNQIVIASSYKVIGTITATGLITLTISSDTITLIRTATNSAGMFGQQYESYITPQFASLRVHTVTYQETERPTIDYDTSIVDLPYDLNNIGSQEFYVPNNLIGYFNLNIGNVQIYGENGNIFKFSDNSQVGTYNATKEVGLIPYLGDNNDTYGYNTVFTDLIGDELGITNVAFKTSATRLTTSSFQLRYETINGSYNAVTDGNGVVTGTDIDNILSRVDSQTGMADIYFTSPVVQMDKIKYDAVAITNMPLDPVLLGLNPIRLPPDGKVPIFDAGRYLVIFDEVDTDINTTPIADAVVTMVRQGQAYIEVVDINGQRLAYDQFVADKVNGTVTFANPLSLIDRQGDALTAPYRVRDRVEDMALCTAADLSGRVSLSAPLTHNYTAANSKIASALVWGNVGSRVFNLYSQTVFINWESQLHGTNTAAQFDDINYPILFNNKDSFSGRFLIEFTASNTVRIREETLGVIASGLPINADISPINPATGLPYFTIQWEGFGTGWLTGNVIYFEMESGSENFWLIRTVQSGTLTLDEDIIDVEIRGDGN